MATYMGPLNETRDAITRLSRLTIKDHYAPILATIQYDGQQFVATDRHIVGTATIDGGRGDEAFLIPADLIAWITKRVYGRRDRYTLLIRVSDEFALAEVLTDGEMDAMLIIHLGEPQTMTTAAVEGTFPPVARLLEQWVDGSGEDAAPIAYNPASLAKIAKAAQGLDTVTLTPGGRSRSGRVIAPTRFTAGPLVGLVQPLRQD